MTLVDNHKAKLAELRRQADILEAELRGMEMLVAAMAAESSSVARVGSVQGVDGGSDLHGGTNAVRRAGRQPGTISGKWRDVLAVMLGHEGPVHIWRAHEIAKVVQQRDMKGSEVQRLFAGYAENGLLRAEGGGYRVTDEAVRRFGLTAKRLQDFQSVFAPNENVSPSEFNEPLGETDTAHTAQ